MKKLLLIGIAALFLACPSASATTLIDPDTDWAPPIKLAPYKCPGDSRGWDAVQFGISHLLSDANRYVIVIDSINPRTGPDGKENRRGGARPVIGLDMKTGVVTFNGKRCKPIPDEELDGPKG